jgi:hypothetical protein
VELRFARMVVAPVVWLPVSLPVSGEADTLSLSGGMPNWYDGCK